MRYTNHDINTNFDSVCRDILKHVEISESEYMTHKQHLSCIKERTKNEQRRTEADYLSRPEDS
ncbi:MAG: hypothetical protein IJ404_01305 [Clostridia bacterium]|nr:hypothetical protein [Clostridia bacterium]